MSNKDVWKEKLLTIDDSHPPDDDDEGVETHASLLKESKKFMLHVVIVGGLAVITYGLRFNVVVLYAKTFENDYSLISTVTYIYHVYLVVDFVC